MSFNIDNKVEELHELFKEIEYQHPMYCIAVNKIVNDIVVEYKKAVKDKNLAINELLKGLRHETCEQHCKCRRQSNT